MRLQKRYTLKEACSAAFCDAEEMLGQQAECTEDKPAVKKDADPKKTEEPKGSSVFYCWDCC